MQNWKDLYKELSEKLTDTVEQIRWVDLWHNQVNFLQDEHPFPTPAVFLNFRTLNINDTGLKVQNINLQVDVFVFYETFADTYKDSVNQESALGFLELLNDVYAALHGTEGDNYSSMRRIGFAPVDTGGAGNLYQISFECTLVDYAAVKKWEDDTIDEVDVIRGGRPILIDGNGFKPDI
ncbi:MAG: hypothetical protein LC105_06085 [Chitinophagales bacterium]|nr:hypothetical protein [Chitinophagales bacterium]